MSKQSIGHDSTNRRLRYYQNGVGCGGVAALAFLREYPTAAHRSGVGAGVGAGVTELTHPHSR